jgi:hypothetical protein
MSNGRCRRRKIVLTLPLSPLLAVTQPPMNPPRKTAQAAALPRRRRREPAPVAGRLRLNCSGLLQSRGRTGGGAGPDSSGGATSPAAAATASDPPAAAAAAPGVLDMKDFTSWTPSTWELLPWDEIHFPKDPNLFGQASIICFDACCAVPESLLMRVPVALGGGNR